MDVKAIILKQNPSADPDQAEKVAVIWEEVVCSILEKMIEYSAAQMGHCHINLREEMCLELAKLNQFISIKVVDDRLKGRSITEIDANDEREQCFDQEGQERIINTAKIMAEHIWVRIYNERWKPKTAAMLEREKNPKRRKLSLKRVEDNHFIPKSFIKRYWSEKEFIYRFIKRTDGQVHREKKSFAQWGYVKHLYSDHLEAYFGLLEGDATRPLEMLLNVEPLNQPQREALVGFLVVQRLRNPHFMETLKSGMAQIVASQVGDNRENDKSYMRAVYESLFRNDDFYDKIARPIYWNRWVIVRSEEPVFILPDVCNIFGTHAGNQFVIMPLTPTDCLIVLPVSEAAIRIVPYYIKASSVLAGDISSLLICEAEEQFLGSSSFQVGGMISEDPRKVLARILQAVTDMTNEKTV